MNILEIGKNIYRLRKERKLTQEDLAKIVGVSVAAVSKWEGGASYPDITLLPQIANFFNVTIDELMSFDNKISTEKSEEIAQICIEKLNENDESGLELCSKYIKKYTKAYELKNLLGGIIMMRAGTIKDKEKQRERYVKALGIYEEIIANCPDNKIVETAIITVGGINMCLEEYETAIDVYSKIKRNDININTFIANAYIKKGDIKKGRSMLQGSLMTELANVESIISALSSSYNNSDMEKAKKYLKFRRDILDVLDRKVDCTDYTHELELFLANGYENEAANCLKNLLLDLKTNKIFDGTYDIPWYADELDVKKKDSKLFKIMDLKKMIIKGLYADEKYENLIKRDDIKELLDRFK